MACEWATLNQYGNDDFLNQWAKSRECQDSKKKIKNKREFGVVEEEWAERNARW